MRERDATALIIQTGIPLRLGTAANRRRRELKRPQVLAAVAVLTA